MCLLQITCAVGLIVQIILLVIQFAQYKTVVNVDLESGQYRTLPALTVCLPIYISVNKVADKYSNVSEIIEAHQQYKNVLATISRLNNHAPFRDKLNKLYQDKFVSFVESKDLSVDELSKLTGAIHTTLHQRRPSLQGLYNWFPDLPGWKVKVYYQVRQEAN